MASKIYTAQELRETAENITRVDVMDGLTCRKHCYLIEKEVESMLRHAAEIQERCEKVIARCNEAKDMNSPTWNFDKQVFAMDLYEIVNYILRGDAGKEEK